MTLLRDHDDTQSARFGKARSLSLSSIATPLDAVFVTMPASAKYGRLANQGAHSYRR